METISIKPATLREIVEIEAILAPYVKEGTILERSRDEIAQNIRSYLLLYLGGRAVGVGALHIYTPLLGEVRSLAIEKGYQGKGLGKRLVEELIKEGQRLGLRDLLVLTYAEEFFTKLGFYKISKEAIPEKKIWQDCIKCRFFPICNEIALIKSL
ncbi:MAG: GNAT family N-acetyltransferase [Epsilonproteobacteria bacterium]|jgi:amino-acid N-acetyltransferase|nr:GNAT family N-acetyltransferase [Campylobacterota bacterium]NPA89001.1 N-acetyltransferase [Campylobacterota bacterium]